MVECCPSRLNFPMENAYDTDIGDSKESKGIKVHLLILTILCFIIYGVIYTILGYTDQLNNFNSPLDGLYFSMTTMSTVGYGDVLPKTTIAKVFVMIIYIMTEFNELLLVIIIVMFIIYFIENSDGIADTNNHIKSETIKEPFITNKFPKIRKKKLNIFQEKEPEIEPRFEIGPDCVEPSKDIDTFHDQFFRFRNIIHENTSIKSDPVTKINMLRVKGDIYHGNQLSDLKISEISDYITKN